MELLTHKMPIANLFSSKLGHCEIQFRPLGLKQATATFGGLLVAGHADANILIAALSFVRLCVLPFLADVAPRFVKLQPVSANAHRKAVLQFSAAHADAEGEGASMQGTSRPVQMPMKGNALQEVFNLDEGPVTLTFPAKMSAASYEELEDHLQIFLRKAKRRAAALQQANADSGDPDSNELG